MEIINLIQNIFSLILGLVTFILCMTIPMRKMWITISFGFATGFLMVLDFRYGAIKGVLLALPMGLFTSLFFVFAGLSLQNKLKRGWIEYRLTHKR